MELSLRLDTLGVVEVRYLRGRERYRDWPPFQLVAASRQARIQAYMSREVAEQLHQQILAVEAAVGLDVEFEEDDDDNHFEKEHSNRPLDDKHFDDATERESSASTFSPSLAQALDRLNELARQRLPEANPSSSAAERSELLAEEGELSAEEEGALEQLQDAFTQMMDVVRELAEEMATDALKLTGRFRCVRTNLIFTQADLPDESEAPEEEGAGEEEEESTTELVDEEAAEEEVMEFEVELVMILQLFEEGRARADDSPAVELQLDVDDFERLHETLDLALQREARGRRRSSSHLTSERGRRNRRRH
ncbi:MAG: hypothetical protein IRZ24_05900 [Thermogemmatispora sp.]|uniref:hypothetical protein n=1 Tax=Thermogemmatispora sp. TaxID=1968838 RepID=UPI001DE34645|nr:hypothetical protein [Thermogemmatispora sp.]MBX5449583.1 hypothetical protein [Thermogemmatispora sp.]